MPLVLNRARPPRRAEAPIRRASYGLASSARATGAEASASAAPAAASIEPAPPALPGRPLARKSRRKGLKNLDSGLQMALALLPLRRGALSVFRPLSALFALAALFVLAAAATASADRLETFASAAGEPIQGYLAKPEGAGPFPAVVLLHSCLGLPSNRRAIETALNGAGYIALFVDEFSTRGLKETCSVDFPQLVPDAFGALAYLSGRPDVDARRVAIVGFSQGADGALAAAASPEGAAHGVAADLRFRAAAAFYPPCANEAGQRLAIPTLIVVGGADEVTPAADCRRLVEGQPGVARLSVYPGVAHCFDDPAFAGGKRVLGMTLRYDAGAARRGMTDLIAFLQGSLAR